MIVHIEEETGRIKLRVRFKHRMKGSRATGTWRPRGATQCFIECERVGSHNMGESGWIPVAQGFVRVKAPDVYTRENGRRAALTAALRDLGRVSSRPERSQRAIRAAVWTAYNERVTPKITVGLSPGAMRVVGLLVENDERRYPMPAPVIATEEVRAELRRVFVPAPRPKKLPAFVVQPIITQ